eukprot:TRINITY_DN1411_c0_g2_i1.p1 TRINITY_DN1411_c0_g2~~TRINITY_DN1411_c0_g2_i1.p1  ORF type:complete len:444 (-),score=90.47 TRINITY_DN1411_c0_g2_i1:165-1496(-)
MYSEDVKKLTGAYKSDKQPPRSAFCKRFDACVGSTFFEWTMQTMVLLSGLNIGCQAHWSLEHLLEDEPVFFQALDSIFTAVFGIELACRIATERSSFLNCNDAKFNWNISDLVIVVVSLSETLLTVSLGTNVVRVVRLARIIRLLRVLRVLRMFSSLRVMVVGALNSAKLLLWALVLLFTVMFMFGTTIMHLLDDRFNTLAEPGERFSDMLQRLKDEDADTVRILLFRFGGLPQTVLSLWLSATAGLDWGDIALPLWSASPLICVIYMAYVAFAILCVLNIVTGVFVESASKLSQSDKDIAIMEDMNYRKQWMEEAVALFREIDSDISETIDLDELVSATQDERVRACFRKIGVDIGPHNVTSLFEIVDFDRNGCLEATEFVDALQQLHGGARSIDILRMKHDLRKIKQSLSHLVSCFQEGATRFDAEDAFVEEPHLQKPRQS